MLMHIFFRNGLRCLLYVSCMCEIWLLGKHLCRNVMENMWQKHIEGSCCSGGGNKEGGNRLWLPSFFSLDTNKHAPLSCIWRVRKFHNENAIISRHCHQRALYDVAGRDHALLLPGGESLDGRTERGAGEGRRVQKTHRAKKITLWVVCRRGGGSGEGNLSSSAPWSDSFNGLEAECGAAFLQNGSTNIRFGEKKEKERRKILKGTIKKKGEHSTAFQSGGAGRAG